MVSPPILTRWNRSDVGEANQGQALLLVTHLDQRRQVRERQKLVLLGASPG